MNRLSEQSLNAVLSADNRFRTARSCLSATGYACLANLDFQWEDETLVIYGSVPTFYLKQLAQERLRPLGMPIRNMVSVRESGSSRRSPGGDLADSLHPKSEFGCR